MYFLTKHKIAGSRGSFEAQGEGLCYAYDAVKQKLYIYKPLASKKLHKIDLKKRPHIEPITLINMIEKTGQIFALTYSNNTSIDLCETVRANKMPVIMRNIVRVAFLCYALSEEDFLTFRKKFLADYSIRDIQIIRSKRKIFKDIPFRVEFRSVHNNSISSRAESLPSLLSTLSRKILQDMAIREYRLSMKDSAQTLVQTSARLAKIAHIVDDDFIPKLLIHKNSIMESRDVGY